jgi:hypothetical protein
MTGPYNNLLSCAPVTVGRSHETVPGEGSIRRGRS